MFTIATFYLFVELENYYDLKGEIEFFCKNQGIKGTIILAEEGINATISGTTKAINEFFIFMNTDDRFFSLEWKKSYAQYQSFEKMKVRLKRWIVNIGSDNLDMNKRGEYTTPEDWDEFVERDDVLLIDTRNTYEIKLGKFKNSLSPETYNFRDFPSWASQLNIDKKQKVAMYCTGGVRCEKSTAYMKHLGFQKVYHLEGGILNYLTKTKNENSAWNGDCFVFDDRVAVDDSLTPSESIKCITCGKKASTDDLKSVPRGQVLCHSCSESD